MCIPVGTVKGQQPCQLMKDDALGADIVTRASGQSWGEIHHDLMPVEIDDWHFTIFNDSDTLGYCEYCRLPDGRAGTLELW